MANTYEGEPCSHCGNTTRYVVEKRCVNCKRLRNATYQRNKTAAGLLTRPESYKVDYNQFDNKDRYFEGKPCKNCGSPYRYINGGRCVKCVAERARRYREKQKGSV